MKVFQFKLNIMYYILIGLALVVLFAWLNIRITSHISEEDHFFPPWNRTRLFLTDGLDPYSNRASRLTQREVYGHTAQSGETQLLFTYPFYAMLVFSPFAAVHNYVFAQSAWMTALQVCILIIAFSSVIFTGWRPSLALLLTYLVFSLTWFYGFYPQMVGNLSLIVALCTTLAILCTIYRQDHLAGILLALATTKPNMVILVVPFVLWWAFSHRRLVMIGSFSIMLTLLIGGAFIVQPDWLIGFLRHLVAYIQHAPPGTTARFFAQRWSLYGLQIGRGLSILLVLLLLREWVQAYRKDETWFLWTYGLTVAITPLIGVQTSPINFMLAFPTLVVLFSLWEQRWQRAGRWFTVFVMGLLLIYPWVSYWRHAGEPVMPASLFFFLPVTLMVALYWMRYWTLSVHKLPVEQIAGQNYHEKLR